MASTVNAAIAGFITALEASTDLAGMTVHDGPPTTAESPEWIAVGYQPGPTGWVTMSGAWAQFGGKKWEETSDILSSSLAASGDGGRAARRSRAVQIRDAIAAAVSADRTLGGA